MEANTGNQVWWNTTEHPVIAELPLEVQAGLIVMYTLTLSLSIFGNLVVIVVFVISCQPRTTLRTFLANLALSDLSMAVFCMPFTFSYTMLNRWVFGPFICTLVLFMQSVSVIVSVGSVTVVAVERYVAVTRPLRRAAYTPLHKWLVLASLWLIAAIISSSQLKVGGLVSSSTENGSVSVPECVETWPEPRDVWRRAYTFFILATTYVLPICIIALCNGAVSRQLARQKIPGHPDEQRDNIRLKSRKRVIKMLMIVTALFGICWFPLHLFTVISDFNPQLQSEGKTTMDDVTSIVYATVHWLAMSNSFVNPIIYSFLNDGFRSDLKWLMKRICGRNRSASEHTINTPCTHLRKSIGNPDLVQLPRDHLIEEHTVHN